MKITESQLRKIVRGLVVGEGYKWYSGPPDSYWDPPDDGPEFNYECECEGSGYVRGKYGRPVMMECPDCEGRGYQSEADMAQAESLANALGIDPDDPEIKEKFACNRCHGEGELECADHPECSGCGGQIVPGEEDKHKSCNYDPPDYDY